MTPFVRRSLPLLALASLAAAALPAQAARPPVAMVRLPQVVLPGIARLTPIADAKPGERLTIGVALQRPRLAAEQRFLADVENPASPSYHHYLTPVQVAERFGVASGTTALVTTQLSKAGLHVDSITKAGDYVGATGTVAQVERAFSTHLATFHAAGTTFLANTVAPLVPAAADVISVVGLNTFQHFRSGATHGAAGQDTCVGGQCTGLTTPQDLWSVYDQPTAFQGQGVRAAVIGEGSPTTVLAAMPAFAKHYKLPQVPLTVHCVEKKSCGTDTGGDVEWEIDTQSIAGMAPKTKGIDLYFSQKIYDASLNLAFLGWIDDTKGPVFANASLYECEATPANSLFTGPLEPLGGNLNGSPVAISGTGNGEESVLDPQLAKAEMEGRTLITISGDVGSSCGNVVLPAGLGYGNGVLNQGVPQQSYPGVSPYVLTVGGTVLYTKDGVTPAARSLEYSWTYGGGGTSYFETAPSWQASTPAIVGRCVSTPTGATTNTGKLCRGVPDEAAQSGDAATNGYGIVDPQGNVGAGGGTSLSAPLTTGMYTRVQSASLLRSRKSVGFLPPRVYAIGNGEEASKAFYDVTVGANGAYAATPGWDYNTGFGTPRVAGLISLLAPPTVGRPVTVPPVSKPPTTTAPTRTSGALPTTGLDVGLPVTALGLMLATGFALRKRP